MRPRSFGAISGHVLACLAILGASYVQAGYQLRSSANRSMHAALVQSPEAGTQPGHIGYILLHMMEFWLCATCLATGG